MCVVGVFGACGQLTQELVQWEFRASWSHTTILWLDQSWLLVVVPLALPPPDEELFTDDFIIDCGAKFSHSRKSVVSGPVTSERQEEEEDQSLLHLTCWNLMQCIWHCLNFGTY